MILLDSFKKRVGQGGIEDGVKEAKKKEHSLSQNTYTPFSIPESITWKFIRSAEFSTIPTSTS